MSPATRKNRASVSNIRPSRSKATARIAGRIGFVDSPGNIRHPATIVWYRRQGPRDDPRRSLSALSSIGSARKDLEAIPDADLRASLRHVTIARPAGDDPFATRPGSAGAATSAGDRFRILRFHAKGGLGQVSVAL